MKSTRLSQLAGFCNARLDGDDIEIEAVAIDSRSLRPGALFVALRGDRFDGHEFAAEAVANGAVAVLCERPLSLPAPQLVVGDSRDALGQIAAGIAAGRGTRLIGITGSNGKTTVKTLLAAILSRVGRCYANPGNRNNEIGLPLALIDQPEDAEFGIYEMGAGQPGDIAILTAIAPPSVSLVNNIASAHLERMGSLRGVAGTKGAIYEALPADGVAVINADDAFGEYFAERVAPRRLIRFALDASADVSVTAINSSDEGMSFRLHTPAGEVDVKLPLHGRHNVGNALAAAALALAVEAPLSAIAEGLASAAGVAGRQTRYRLANGTLLIDDSYNANPASVAAAIRTLSASSGESWLVLGDMAELGPDSARLHADCGAMAKDAGITRLFTVGPQSAASSRAFGTGARHFEDQEGLIEVLRAGLSSGSRESGIRCLVKGSRSSAMERVVRALLDSHAGETNDRSHDSREAGNAA
ncbi:MAG: UDP-N-acetylmuramoyl-tripeptide--D-alanyl-D-alanine ligase [Lysobacteraceae bacterium]